ncbi:hypothetical protein ACWD4V_01075 [Streptomyces tsukubensis]
MTTPTPAVPPVSRPYPWDGRIIVRAAGGTLLHIALRQALMPAAPVFTLPVECHPDPDTAPGLRRWTGPVDEALVCPTCLTALHHGQNPAHRVPQAAPPPGRPGPPTPEGRGSAEVPRARTAGRVRWTAGSLAAMTRYPQAAVQPAGA